MKKRYAIVRVDDVCPPVKMFCSDRKIDCKNCLYGDTKEQMIRKIAQVIYRNLPKETYTPKYVEQKEKILEIATKIVEFLGVE